MAEDPWAKLGTPVESDWDALGTAVTPASERTMGDYTKDIVKSAGKGLSEGAAAVLGIPSDVWKLLDRGYQYALSEVAERAGALKPGDAARIRKPIEGLEDYNLTTDALTDRMRKMGVLPDYKPQTTAGKYAETISSFAPGAVAFGTPGAANIPGSVLKYAAVPGAVSETAGQITEGTELEPAARGVGALAGMAPSMVFDVFRSPTRPLREAIRNASAADMTAAQKLLEESRLSGAPLTLAEALDYTTKGATSLGDVMRVIEQTATGSPTMRRFFADRPEQTAQLTDRTLTNMAPGQIASDTIPPRVQTAAQKEIATSPEGQAMDQSMFAVGPRLTPEETGAAIRPEIQQTYTGREGMRAAQADADYAAARAADNNPETGGPAEPVQIGPVINYVDDLLANAKGPVAAALRSVRETLFSNGQPDKTVTGLGNARQAITGIISRETAAGDRVTSRVLEDVLGQLDSALEQVPAYGQARRNFAANSEPLRPFEEGTVGGKIVEKDQYGRNYTLPTEQIPSTIEKAGATGADQFLEAAANSPNAKNAFSWYFANKMLENARDSAGKIDVGKLKTLLADNEDLLKRFPDIRNRLGNVQQAREALGVLETSPTGKLADTESFSKQINVLFPPANSRELVPGMEKTVGKAVSDVVKHDPEAASQLVRLYAEQAFNKAAEVKQGVANQWAGPRFVAQLTGNTQMAENLKAAVTALPNGGVRWNAMQKALKIMQAQGMRQPVGSKTAFNTQMQSEMKQGSLAADVAAHIPSPSGMAGAVAKWFEELRYGNRASEFAKVFTEGNIDDLRKLSKAPVGSSKGVTALNDVLVATDEPERANYARGGSVDTSLPYSDPSDPTESSSAPSPYLMTVFQEASKSSGVPLDVLLAVAKRESNFNPKARGRSGEMGLMQIMPSTARQPGYGVAPVDDTELFNPSTNINFGAQYLAARAKSEGVKDWNDPIQRAKALKAYNGGGDPNYVENVSRYLPQTPTEPVQPVEETAETTDNTIPEVTVGELPPLQPESLSPQQRAQVLAYVQKLLGNQRYFAEGGLVQSDVPTTPEPQRDIAAQTDTMADPAAGKDAVFIATGSPLPSDIPDGAILVKRPEGFLLTMNPQKAAAYQEAPELTDTFMADILGYSEPKSQTENPVVMQGVQPPDQVTSEQLATPGNEDAAVQAILAQDPTAALRVMTPDQAQQRRAAA
jgi:hypothetical protein